MIPLVLRTFALLLAYACVLAMPTLAGAVTVSGTAMKDEVGNPWQGCDGSANLAIAVDGVHRGTTACAGDTGTFAFTGITIPAAGSVVTVWFDGAPVRGALVTTAASTTADITGLTPTQDRLWLRTEQGAVTRSTNALLGWTSANDPDVPVTRSWSDVVLPTGVELHVDSPLTLTASGTTDATSIHVEAGAAFDGSAGQTTIRGVGALACDQGPGLARPLCVEGTFPGAGRVVYMRQQRPFVIEPLHYGSLVVAGDAEGVGTIGYASGQHLRVDQSLEVQSSLRSDPWAANVTAAGIYLNGWADHGAGPTNPSWTGTRPFTITYRWGFEGGGSVDLPGTTVVANIEGPKSFFGPTGGSQRSPDWSLRSVTFRNTGYWRWAYGTSGMTGMVGTAAADRTIDVTGQSWSWGYQVVQLGENGGDWGLMRYNFDGVVDADWDDGDLNSTNDDGDALLSFNSSGTVADVPWAAVVDPSTGSLLVAGSSGGNWMLRRYDTHGRLDTTFNGTGVISLDLGGADEIRGLVLRNGTIAVAGTGGSTPAWHVRTYNSTGAQTAALSWSNGTAGAHVRGLCYQEWGGLYVVGRIGAAGARDWAAKRIDTAWAAWTSFGPAAASAAWTWNAGGTEDEATTCTADTADHLFIAGTAGSGTDDDVRIRQFWTDGWPKGEWGDGGSGIVSFGTAGDDDVHEIVNDDWADSLTVVGRDPVSGGRAFIRRYDPDGDLDTTWAGGGILTWDQAAGTDERATSIFWDGGQYLRVGLQAGSNGGDATMRRYDFNGDLMDSWAAGNARVHLRNSYSGRSRVTVEESVRVGQASDAGTIMLDLESHDTRLTTGGIEVASNGRLRASSTNPLVSLGDVFLDGAFWANRGEFRLESQSRAQLRTTPTTRFRNLTVEGAGKPVTIAPANPLRVDGTFRVRGATCADPVTLGSASEPTAWTLDLSGGGTADVQFADIRSSTASPSATATNSRSLGANTGWTISGCTGTAMPPPEAMHVEGQFHAQAVGTPTPVLSWINRNGATVDRGDVEVYSSPLTRQAALWRFDGNGADSAGPWSLTPATTASYSAGRFGQAGDSPATFDGWNGGDLDLPGEFTVDGWVKSTLPIADAASHVAYKGDAGRTAVNYRLGFDSAANRFEAMMTLGGQQVRAAVDAARVADGTWHHVAMVHREGRVMLYLDGEMVRNADGNSTAPDQGAWNVSVGRRIRGAVDDVRIATVAYPPADIRGLYRTGRRHADLVWDFDPSNSTGTVLAATTANGSRANVTYGGETGSLRLSGARYWARARLRTQGTTTWSAWSDFDWWATDQSITTAVVTSPAVSLGAGGGTLLPGQDALGTVTFEVTTTNFHGYTSWIEGPSDGWALSDGLPGANHEIAGRGSSPAPWAAGTSGFAGVSVLSATGGKDTARWGSGTSATDMASLNWAWGSPSTRLQLTSRSDYFPTAQQVQLAVRANASPAQDPGRYSTTLVFTALANV